MCAIKNNDVNHGLHQFTKCVCINWYSLVKMALGIMLVDNVTKRNTIAIQIYMEKL